jgi:hypothetical protein
MPEHTSIPVFDDERGRLIPIEFAQLPFVPQRCFVVTAPGRAADRGGHRAGCRQVLLLLNGSVQIRLKSDDDVTEHRLANPGASVLIEADTFIDYRLETPDTQVLVLAEEPYLARTP